MTNLPNIESSDGVSSFAYEAQIVCEASLIRFVSLWTFLPPQLLIGTFSSGTAFRLEQLVVAKNG